MINEERNEELFDALIKVAISYALKNEMDALPSNEELNKYFKSSKELNKRIEKLIMQRKIKAKTKYFVKSIRKYQVQLRLMQNKSYE